MQQYNMTGTTKDLYSPKILLLVFIILSSLVIVAIAAAVLRRTFAAQLPSTCFVVPEQTIF